MKFAKIKLFWCDISKNAAFSVQTLHIVRLSNEELYESILIIVLTWLLSNVEFVVDEIKLEAKLLHF